MNQMTQADARAFIIALNNIAQYVPPMHMQQVTNNPLCRIIEQMANAEEKNRIASTEPEERPRPHVVS